MKQFLLSLPKATIVFLALAVGTLLIVASDPPKTICDAQKEKVTEELAPILAPAKLDGLKSSITKYQRLMTHCQSTNSPGGCFELFAQVRKVLAIVASSDQSCQSEIGSISSLKKSLWQTSELMVRIAWGTEPPKSYYEKMGWLQYADMNLFCQVKKKLVMLYGDRSWQEFQERMMGALPGVDKVGRKKAWNRMIISLDCRNFL